MTETEVTTAPTAERTTEYARDMKAIRRRARARTAKKALYYAVLTVVGVTMVLPFIWMVSMSLKTKDAAVEIPPKWLPRRHETVAVMDGASVPVRVLKTTSEVKRLDTGETLTVYSQSVRMSKPWWKAWGTGESTANVVSTETGRRERAPVEVLSSTAMVRILEDGPRRHTLANIPADTVHERSWVSLEWSNYPEAWNKLPFDRSYVNTVVVSVTVTLGQLLTCSLAAFAFARLRFPWRDKLFFGYLATMMIPGAVTLIPVYILFVKMPDLLNAAFSTEWFQSDLYFLGRYYTGRLLGGNSYFAMIAPGLFSAYGTFMLRQFFMGLPRDLEDAARIDGCGNLRVYWHVVLPLSKVALATLAVFVFMGAWKSFMWPLIIINREELVPLQVLLQRFQGQYNAEYTLLMASSIIVLAPMLVVFLLGQKYFVKGIQLGAVKG